MADRITANLPSRDLAHTEAFFARLGCVTRLRDEGGSLLRIIDNADTGEVV